MTPEQYLEEAEKIDYEGGLLSYVHGYGGRSMDPELQLIYDCIRTIVNKYEKDVHAHFRRNGVDLSRLQIIEEANVIN